MEIKDLIGYYSAKNSVRACLPLTLEVEVVRTHIDKIAIVITDNKEVQNKNKQRI